MMGLEAFEQPPEHEVKLVHHKLGPSVRLRTPHCTPLWLPYHRVRAGKCDPGSKALKSEIRKFTERMKPHADAAAGARRHHCRENHSGLILSTRRHQVVR